MRCSAIMAVVFFEIIDRSALFLEEEWPAMQDVALQTQKFGGVRTNELCEHVRVDGFRYR